MKKIKISKKNIDKIIEHYFKLAKKRKLYQHHSMFIEYEIQICNDNSELIALVRSYKTSNECDIFIY